MNGDQLGSMARRLLGMATKGEQIEVYLARGRSTTVKAYDGEVESLKSGESHGAGVRVVTEGREGFASAGSLDPAILVEVLDEARSNAALSEPDPNVGLTGPDGVVAPSLELLDPDLDRVEDSERIRLALELEKRARSIDPRVTGVRTSIYSDGIGEVRVVSTEGIDTGSRAGTASMSVSPLAVDGEETQIGFASDAARHPRLLDPAEVAAEAVDRAVSMLGADKPASGRMTAVLDKRVVASFMALVGATLTGEMVRKGRSPFGDRLGEEIAVSGLNLVDDPTDPESLAAGIHDGEGLAVRRNVLIGGGVLERILHNSETARWAGTRSTGSAVRGSRSTPGVGLQAMRIEPGDVGFADMLARVGEGVYIRSVNGLHSGTNLISGDVSVGIQGHMIRDGALAEPVREATIATTLQRMLRELVMIGSDFEFLPGGTGSVTMAVDGIALSGR
ncbi:MAG TPA: TldD/PmbA family protein [Acidimicrobiales bacterium]|nr:TldD/PmbA family protein [Acidimicrobiales bacterium]